MFTYSLFDDFSTNFLSPLRRSCRTILFSSADEKSVTQQSKENQRKFPRASTFILNSFNIISLFLLLLYIVHKLLEQCEVV